jgi:hypothetical protein
VTSAYVGATWGTVVGLGNVGTVVVLSDVGGSGGGPCTLLVMIVSPSESTINLGGDASGMSGTWCGISSSDVGFAPWLWKGHPHDVWKELPNSKVAYRIADKVIQAKGDNKFLGSGGSIHCGIGNDFKFTENGIERKDQCFQ